VAEVPVQFSALSQTSATPRQMVDEVDSVSPGQAADVPLQTSAESQTPPDPLHVVAVVESEFTGHEPDEPVHVSAGSQTPAESRHVVEVEESESAGQFAVEPVQDSAGSHTPVEVRHTPARGVPPVQVPAPLQVPPLRQTLAPLHESPFELKHESVASWHWLQTVSGQGSPLGKVHVWFTHVSVPLQNRPSSQGMLSVLPVPPVQRPTWLHESAFVQPLLSLHGAFWPVNWQLVLQHVKAK
jgi:hypothetical protein